MRCLYCHSVIAAEPTLVSLFKRDEPLCLTCREKLTFKFPGERCGRCHQLVNKKTEVCSDCELLIGVYPHINKIYTVTDYNEETKMLMHRYKFVKDYALAEVLALLCSFSFKPYHAVVPIPVSTVRLKKELIIRHRQCSMSGDQICRTAWDEEVVTAVGFNET